jgi:hypothetical protein
MPILKNTRHEQFCQAVCGGLNNAEAYGKVYKNCDRKAAWKLRQREDIEYRIHELKSQIAEIHQKATERAIEAVVEKCAVTKEAILTELATIAFAKVDLDAIKANDKRSALVDLGRFLGLLVDRVEVSKPVDTKSAAEQRAELVAMLADLGVLPADIGLSEIEPDGVANRPVMGNGTTH